MAKTIIEDTLNIYTDGSSYSHPRVGGIGIRYIYINQNGNEEIIDLNIPGYKSATNNQMELHACVCSLHEAMKRFDLSDFNRIIIYTDSLYIKENLNNAKYQWPKTKWLKRSGSPVLNADLWKVLIRNIKKTNKHVEIKWVKGHKKDMHNKAVDKLAKKSAKQPLKRSLTVTQVRRKLTRKSVELKSVEMRGQRISIHIITSEYLKVQHINKYKYEVISKRSRFYQNVDIIFSDKLLKAGHSYTVTFNKNSNDPRIVSIIREII